MEVITDKDSWHAEINICPRYKQYTVTFLQARNIYIYIRVCVCVCVCYYTQKKLIIITIINILLSCNVGDRGLNDRLIISGPFLFVSVRNWQLKMLFQALAFSHHAISHYCTLPSPMAIIISVHICVNIYT